MRRALLVTVATVAGVAYVLSYRVTPHPSGLASASGGGEAGSRPLASPSPVATPAAGSSAGPTPTPAPAAAASGTFTGPDVPNRFGDVQVRVVVSNGHITDVRSVQLPEDRAQSAYISSVAGPMLRTEALQAQSARIDIISGATYTSISYAQSLESALKQAHLG